MRNLILLVFLMGLGCSKRDNSKDVLSDKVMDSTSEEEMTFNGPRIFEKNQKWQDTFPFSKSDKIQLVSYDTRRDSYSDRDLIYKGKFSVENVKQEVTLNSKKEAIAFFEICFECGGTKQSLGVDFGQFCPEKQCMLQKFFKANKAGFGIIDEVCE